MSARLKSIYFIWLFALVGVNGWSASASKDEKPVIPPDLFFEFKPVSADENAIINWRRATEVMTPLSDKERQNIRFCWTAGMSEPSAEDLAELQNWIRQNQDALRLFNESLQKPKAQWLEESLQKVQPELRFGQLIRARLFEADQQAEQDKMVEATKSLEDSLKLTQLGVNGDAAQIHYLISAASRVLVQDAILRLAGRRKIPLPLLQKLLQDLPNIDSETNTYACIVRLDFSIHDYQTLHDLDLKRMAEMWSKISETNLAMALYPEELRRPFKVLIDPLLIAKHSKPIDMAAIIKNDIHQYRVSLTNAFSAWTNYNPVIKKEREETKKQLLEDIQPLMDLVKNEPLPLSRQAANRVLNVYLKIENPIGRIFSTTSLEESDVRLFHYRTEREATRTILALLIFEREKGVLPAKLSDLVDAGILKSVPNDPFACAPISYSKERQIIWSFGENGMNDNGDGDDVSRWVGDDAVWKIPELK